MRPDDDGSETGSAFSKEDAEPRFCEAMDRVVWFRDGECLTPFRPTPALDYLICELIFVYPGYCLAQSRLASAHEALEDALRRDDEEPNP